MSDIDALRQRVEAAERNFGLIDERDRKYSARLISLISNIEGQVNSHQAEIDRREERLTVLERENGELRGMLHSLLLAVEDGGHDRIGETVNDMDQRISALVTDAPASDDADAPAAEAEEPEVVETEVSSSDEDGSAEDEALEILAEAPAVGEDSTDEDTAEEAEPDIMADLGDDDFADAGSDEDQAAEDDVLAALDEPIEEPSAEDAAAEEAAAEDGATEDTAADEDVLAALDEPLDDIAEAPADDIVSEADGEDEIDLSMIDDEPDADSADSGPEEAVAEAPAPELEGTDMVMPSSGSGGDAGPASGADSGAEPVDPALAERAEKIAELLSSGDEADPTVKEIIDKVTELAATIEATSKLEESEGGAADAETAAA